MSYRDPYSSGQYPQQYQDAPFDPYSVQHQHASRPYEQGGATYGEGGLGYAEQDYAGRPKEERSGFDLDDPVPAPLGEKYVSSPQDMSLVLTEVPPLLVHQEM